MVNREGQRLGNYRLIRWLGKGAFAEVYLGEHLYLKNYAAIKILLAALLTISLPQPAVVSARWA